MGEWGLGGGAWSRPEGPSPSPEGPEPAPSPGGAGAPQRSVPGPQQGPRPAPRAPPRLPALRPPLKAAAPRQEDVRCCCPGRPREQPKEPGARPPSSPGHQQLPGTPHSRNQLLSPPCKDLLKQKSVFFLFFFFFSLSPSLLSSPQVAGRKWLENPRGAESPGARRVPAGGTVGGAAALAAGPPELGGSQTNWAGNSSCLSPCCDTSASARVKPGWQSSKTPQIGLPRASSACRMPESESWSRHQRLGCFDSKGLQSCQIQEGLPAANWERLVECRRRAIHPTPPL